MIDRIGPSTPYAVETAVEKSVAYLWKFPHSQLYREPERLTSFGLLTAERELTGRRRNIYRLTPSGREALDAWLNAPADDAFEIRDDAVLRLLFSDNLDPEQIIELARGKAAFYQSRLQVFTDIYDIEHAKHGNSRCITPLQLSIRLNRTLRDFWLDIAAALPPSSPVGTDLPDAYVVHRRNS
jgi:PadR family transcriptional regulator, regulatory protein AphA